MKIQIRPRGITLTKTQAVGVERDLGLALGRYGERIDRVIVDLSEGDDEGLTCCEIEVRLKPQIMRVEHTDTDVVHAIEHAALRVGRSVRRAIETEGLVRR